MDSIATLLPIGRPDAAHGARRASQRFPFHADVELVEPIHTTGVTINASAGGLRVAVEHAVALGDLCVARIRTAVGRETTEKLRVVWRRELPDGWLMGLQFADLH